MKPVNETHIHLNFETLTNVTIGELYRMNPESIVTVIVTDKQYNDVFTIKLQETNRGIGGLCFLNNEPSYQADFISGETYRLKKVINDISGGDAFSD